MVSLNTTYDVAIVGGGLAGLALSIQLARKGHAVILFEKEKYPYHKVCGEYISMESWPFLTTLGIPLSALNLPEIKRLQISAPNGNQFNTALTLGGFGISRYMLDHKLADLAKEAGVTVLEETKVNEVTGLDQQFLVQYVSHKEGLPKQIEAKVCCGTFGKRSNLDIKWKRDFVQKKDPRINNYIAVKYHIKTNWPSDLIALHNFHNGYCGISKIEGDKYCLCYLTTADNLKQSNQSIAVMEQNILFKNPALKEIFSNSAFLYEAPVTIAQISFSPKTVFENGIMMIGDASGMITPLCGNGMSMALRGSKMAAQVIDDFLQTRITWNQLQNQYIHQWKKAFGSRLFAGRVLQSFFGADALSNLFVSSFKHMPWLAKPIIRTTHGDPF
jgi:flavin-dependent dehydrogenase